MATFGQAADEESPVEVPRYYIGVDVNENVTAVTKLLCLKKPLSPVKTLSVIDLEDQNSNVAKKNRNSFHQNVEEALSSLLWQPYEYQQQKAVDGGGSSCCSGSSGCSSASGASSVCDLEEATNNGSPTAERYASYTDLYRSTEMVNNLPRLDQWLTAVGSRDAERPISTYLSERILSQSSNAVVRRYSRSVPQKCNVSDMQVEVHNCSVPPTTTSVLNINATGNDGLRTAAATAVAVVPPPLSSANVVGLPRYGTVPSQQSHNRQQHSAGTIFPNHPRQQSEPSNQFRLSANNAVVPISNANANVVRHTSQMDQSNLQLISHLRSASVPKSMPVQTRTEASFVSTVPSTTQANINNTLVPSHSRYNSEPSLKNKPPLNISNINVNFYRAVPVNVVSSVPTIQCINSTVQGADVGNNVSNVQIMPLGNIGAHHLPSSAITGTTQVTVHNTPTPTHSIQIPTNFQRPTTTSNINNNQQQIIIQNNRSTSTTSTTTVPQQQTLGRNAGNQVVVPVQSNPQLTRTRTFTSTEAQTDDISVCPAQPSEQREQRRRERRERRHQRRVNNTNHRHTADSSTQANSLQNDRLPDILNSHLPPPYTTMGNNQSQPPPIPPPPAALMHNHPHPVMVPNPVLVPPMVPAPPHGAVIQTVVPNNVVPSGFAFAPHHQQVVAGQVPIVQGAAPVAVSVPPPSGFRFPFPNGGFRRGRFSEESPKSCCGLLSWKPGSLRWFIALIALVAVCCVLIGTTLGAMRPAGRDHLTVSLLMIGVGIVLVTVSGVAWRLTSHDSSTCRSMLGLGSTESVDVCTRRFVPRLPPSYGRPHHPYAAMMYPEFQYRPPPPSYQASMQEYRLRLLLLDRGNTPHIQNGIQNAVSPPPTYRSHAGSLLRAPLSSRRDAAQSEYSCPPSYRSQNSSNRQGTLQTNSVLHSREQSLSLSESNHGGSVVNVVNILGSTEEDIALDNITLDSLKMDPESDINPLKMLLKGSTSDLEGSKDGNLVTIVQTSDQNPVIVTVSGSSQLESTTNSVQITEIPSEMEILAHL